MKAWPDKKVRVVVETTWGFEVPDVDVDVEIEINFRLSGP